MILILVFNLILPREPRQFFSGRPLTGDVLIPRSHTFSRTREHFRSVVSDFAVHDTRTTGRNFARVAVLCHFESVGRSIGKLIAVGVS